VTVLQAVGFINEERVGVGSQ
ncbi:hypothetical protein A2U01_0039038, partial [Trifolium medium]|nr:hypothetical protein [Trifolium medium]